MTETDATPVYETRTFRNRNDGEITLTLDNTRDAKLTDFGMATVAERYLLPGETPQRMFGRVAAWFAKDPAHAQRTYDAMSKMWFMPSTPILSNGGTNRGNPISCFLNAVPDSLEGIAGVWNENVWLAAKGGGIGTYWGGVREIKATIGDSDPTQPLGETSGVIPFIKVQDSMTLGISQGSLRRGSAAVYLDIHHPEIEEFIDVRRKEGDANRRSLNIHHGVNITDAFMEAARTNADFDLISPKDGRVVKTVKARDLFIKLLKTRVETGEPYMLFVDTVNRDLPPIYKAFDMKVQQSNLCSEITLHTGPDYLDTDRTAVCCLASVNEATQDEWYGDEQFIQDVLYFLDEVIDDFIDRTNDVDGFDKARYSAYMERSIGLGTMGFHTYLQSKMIPFESAVAEGAARRVQSWVKKTADKINVQAARELGPNRDSQIAEAYGKDITPVRWSNMLAIAPTASISIIAGTVSACHEPIPANIFTQKTLSGSFTVKNPHLDALLKKRFYERNPLPEELECEPCANQFRDENCATFLEETWSSILMNEGSVQNLDFLTQEDKDVFKTAFELDQRWVISNAAARAKDVCQAISNNINLPADVDDVTLMKLHVQGWRAGLKSFYYLRSKSLVRATNIGHVAGEMPQPREDTGVHLVEGPAPSIDYEICTSCQ